MNIFVIREGAVGDAVLTFPILVALRAKYSNPHITFVASPIVAPLAKAWGLAEEESNYHDLLWDEPFTAAGVRSPYLRELFQRTDLAIGLVPVTDGLVAENLRAAGVKEVIVARGKPPINPTKHLFDYMIEPLQPLGLGLQQSSTTYPGLPVMGEKRPYPDKPPIAIHPGASQEFRRWPLSHIAKLIKRLLDLNYPVLLLTGPFETNLEKDRAMRKYLSAAPSPMLTVLKNASLVEVAERLKQCGCFLGHDTGPTHLAGLMGIPTIALFGPSDPAISRPLGPHVEVIRQQPFKSLSVDRVLQSVLRAYHCHDNHIPYKGG